MSKSKKEWENKNPSKAQLKCDINEYLTRLAESADEQIEAGEAEEGDEKGKIWHILHLHIKGYSNGEIINLAGFNRNTVYRQVGEYDKLRTAPAKSYQGFEIYVARLQRIMSRKKMSREKAMAYLAEKDLEATD